MTDSRSSSSWRGVGDPSASRDPAHASEEELLDELFDQVTTRILNSEPVDVAELMAQHEHLAARIPEMVRLASEVVGQGAPSMRDAIPGYEIVRELGRGGMGTVFLAQQASLGGRLVALKVLPQGAALSSQARTRFRSEAQALARLRHAHVIDIYDVIDSDITLAYAMEWVDGRSLLELSDHYVALGRPRESVAMAAFLGGSLGDERMVRVVARWGQQVATALSAAHAQGLLHRDVKPANVLVRRDGTAVLSDFGLVRDEDSSVVTRSGAFLGTPAYASPEQLRGGLVDERADVYGLGATLYHALGGAPPFSPRAHADVLRRVEDGPRQSLRKLASWVDRDLATIVETAMAVDVARRYACADALAQDLQRYFDGQPIHAQPANAWLRVRKFARRNRHSLGGALAGSLVVLAVTIALAMYWIRQSQIPAEFAAQVRTARLAMLDPGFDERVFAMMQNAVRPSAQQRVRERLVREKVRLGDDDRAIAQFCLQAALDLQDDVAIRAEHDTVALARHQSASRALANVAPTTTALATRWPEANEPPAVSEPQLAAMSRQDRRCLGLLAFLRGADALCVAAWSGLDLAQSPDAFVDAALGQLYRQRRQPQLAWPRLERAFEHFEQASFLAVAIADVALACGDAAYSLRVLQRVPPEAAGPYATVDRVRADALLALGRRDEARAIYLTHAARGNVPPSSHVSLAAFFLSEADYRRAFHHCWRVQLRWPGYPGGVARLADVLEQWWRSLEEVGRRALLTETCAQPGGFADALCCVVANADVSQWPFLARLANTLVHDAGQLAVVRRWPAARRARFLDRVLAGGAEAVPIADAVLGTPTPVDGERRIVSVGVDGALADADCQQVVLSADGQVLAFSTAARNLVAGAANGVQHVYGHDVASGRTRRLSSCGDGSAANGASRSPTVSADGRLVAFYSEASDLVSDDHNEQWDCFVGELATGRVFCVSVDEQGKPAGIGTTPSRAPAFSADGLRLVFVQTRERLGSQLVLADLATRRCVAMGLVASRPWDEVRFVGNGKLVLATNSDAELREPDANHWNADVFAFEAGRVEAERVSEVHGRQADLECRLAGSSADGNLLLLWTGASNLITIDNPGARNLLLVDRTTHAVQRINERDGVGFEAFAGASTNGRRTVFASLGPAGHDSEWPQVWLRDAVSLRLVSHSGTGRAGEGGSDQPQLSLDGRVCAFLTTARDLLEQAGREVASPPCAQVVWGRLPD